MKNMLGTRSQLKGRVTTNGQGSEIHLSSKDGNKEIVITNEVVVSEGKRKIEKSMLSIVDLDCNENITYRVLGCREAELTEDTFKTLLEYCIQQ